MDSHAAPRLPCLSGDGPTRSPLLDAIKLGSSEGFDHKMRALLHISRTVRRQPLDLTAADVETALAAGATDADVQLAVLIAAGVLDVQPDGRGLRAVTPPSAEAYRAGAARSPRTGTAERRPPACRRRRPSRPRPAERPATSQQGDDMATKTDFTEEEWETLQQGRHRERACSSRSPIATSPTRSARRARWRKYIAGQQVAASEPLVRELAKAAGPASA